MTAAHRISNLAGVVLPLLAVLAAIVLLWNTLVGWADLALLAAMYVATGLGITVGFHRMLTHRVLRDPPLRAVRARDRWARWPSRAP